MKGRERKREKNVFRDILKGLITRSLTLLNQLGKNTTLTNIRVNCGEDLYKQNKI